MESVITRLLATALLLMGLQATADTPMPQFSASYTLENKFVTGGIATLSLSSDSGQHRLMLETTPTGVFKYIDKGKTREIAELGSLTPPYLAHKYAYTNFGDEHRSYESTYDRQSGEATMVRNGFSKNFPIDVDAVDRLSSTLSVMQALRENPDVAEFSVSIIDRENSQINNYISRGRETIKTDMGKLSAIRIDRQRSGSDRQTIMWFAQLGSDALPAPVKIEQYKRGKLQVRLKITDFSTPASQ